MPAPKGIKAVEWLRKRAREQRGGRTVSAARTMTGALRTHWPSGTRPTWNLSAPATTAAAHWKVEATRSKCFWAGPRSAISTRRPKSPARSWKPIQRWLWRYTKANGHRLGWSTQRNRLGIAQGLLSLDHRQNVILHNPASELELPRMEKRLPTGQRSRSGEVERLLAVPNVTDPLGVRDRAMLELFYSCGLRRAELCRLELTDLNAERRTCAVRGKGKKDRVVPVGAAGRATGSIVTSGKCARVCAWTRAPRPCSSPATARRSIPMSSRRMVSQLAEASRAQGKGCCHLLRHTCATHMLDRRRRHPLHPATPRTRETRDHRHLHRSLDQTTPGSPCPLPSRIAVAR